MRALTTQATDVYVRSHQKKREREREMKRGRKRERVKEREREYLCRRELTTDGQCYHVFV